MQHHRAPPSPSCDLGYAAMALQLTRMMSEEDPDDIPMVPGYFAMGENFLRGLHNRVERVAKMNNWEHEHYNKEIALCKHCNTIGWSVGLKQEPNTKRQNECLGTPWLCKSRQYITSTHNMTIPDNLMSVSEYLAEARKLMQGHTLPKAWKYLTQWNELLVKAQPQLKKVADIFEVTIFQQGYLPMYLDNNFKLVMPSLGDELLPTLKLENSTSLLRNVPFYRFDAIFKEGNLDVNEEGQFDVSMNECLSQEEGVDEPDGASSQKDLKTTMVFNSFLGISIDLSESQKGVRLYFETDNIPCEFCRKLSKKTQEWTNCTGNEQSDYAKYKLIQEKLPFLQSGKEVFKAMTQCADLKKYQKWLNIIFTCYDINRSVGVMVSFNNKLLECVPHMKKYITIYEAVVHKSWGCLGYINNKVF